MEKTFTPGINNVSCYLQNTVSILEMLIDKYFCDSFESVTNKDTLCVLSTNNFNNNTTGRAFEVVRTYGVVSDCIHVLQDRLEEAIRICEEIEGINLQLAHF